MKQIKPVDVFSYAIDKPVTVKRDQSALVPFLSAECSALSCSLYNEGDLSLTLAFGWLFACLLAHSLSSLSRRERQEPADGRAFQEHL